MRYIVAGIISAFLIIAMVVFSFLVMSRAKIWEEQGAELPGIVKVLLESADFISGYWFILVPCIIVACFGVALCLPKKRNSHESTI